MLFSLCSQEAFNEIVYYSSVYFIILLYLIFTNSVVFAGLGLDDGVELVVADVTSPNAVLFTLRLDQSMDT